MTSSSTSTAAITPKMQSYHAALRVRRFFVYAVMLILTLLAVVPIYLLLVNATRNTEEINQGLSLLPSTNLLYNWRALTGRGFQIWQGFWNSAFIAISATVLCVYFSSMTAYGVHVYRFRGQKVLWAVILFIMLLPASLSFIGFYQFMARLHLLDNYIPLIIPSIASASVVLFMRQYMQSILSKELIEAARIDGAGEFRIFNMVVLPVLSPAIAAQAIFAFVSSWNNFFTPFVLISSQKKYTLPMLVQTLRGDIYRTEYGGIYLGIAVSIVPILIFYVLMSRYIISGVAAGGVKE